MKWLKDPSLPDRNAWGLIETYAVNAPKPRDMAICDTYALQPEGWIHGGTYGDCEIQGKLWRIKRPHNNDGWLGPVLFRYEAQDGYDVFAVFCWSELKKFMDLYDLVVF